MKVLLTGATGYIGSAVADALAEAGHEVTGPARSTEAVERLQKRNIRTHPGDLNDPRSLTLAAGESDAVIHTTLPHGPDEPQADKNAVQAFPGALHRVDKKLVRFSSLLSGPRTGAREAHGHVVLVLRRE